MFQEAFNVQGTVPNNEAIVGTALSGLVATVTHSKKHSSKSTEDLNLPSGLGFLRDTTVIPLCQWD